MTRRIVARRAQLIGATSVLSIAVYCRQQYQQPIANESSPVKAYTETPKAKLLSTGLPPVRPSKYSMFVWGSNRNNTLLPPAAGSTLNVKTPKLAISLQATPLRDLVLHETYGAAVDVAGDIWMWGKGYCSDDIQADQPGLSLRGKDISVLAPTESKLYALSEKTGDIYAIAASKDLQAQRQDQVTPIPWWYLGLGRWITKDPGVDCIRLRAEGGLANGEKFVSLVSGKSHILALTSKGRTFSMATGPDGNSHGQLGVKAELASSTSDSTGNIRWNDELRTITSLSSIPIAQIAAGLRSSYFRMPDGRVLGLGGNAFGQLGLGALASVEVVPIPSEVVLARSYPPGVTVKCVNIAAGGNNAYYTVERASTIDPTQKFVDLLAVGTGIAGGLGNGLWSSASSNPVKVKSVSGLQEYSEALSSFVPLEIGDVSVSNSPNAHVFVTLNTVGQSEAKGVDDGKYGNDVMAFGANQDYQLGNAKRSSLAIPQHLPPLVKKGPDQATREQPIGSGTLSPMPHSRLQLHKGTVDAYDLQGRLLKKRVNAQQVIYAGYNSSCVYWKVT